jgi:hypothetical protein
MKYLELIKELSEQTGHPLDTVKAIIEALPNVLLNLLPEDRVETPLGVFYHHISNVERDIKLPDGKTSAKVHPHSSIKLKGSQNLKIK